MASSGWLTPYQTLVDGGFGYDYFKGAISIDSITHTSGTVTVVAHFGVYNDGGANSYYQDPINAKIRNIMANWSLVVSGGTWIDTNQWVTAQPFTFSFSAADSDTSATITVDWTYHGGYSGNSISYTLYFDPLVPTPTLTGAGTTETSATLNWLVGDGSGSISGTGYVYRGTSASPTTQAFTTTNKTDTFVDTGLTPNTTYYYRGRIKDSNNNWGAYTSDVTLTTLPQSYLLYGSVGGVSKKTTKWLGSVNGQSKYIVKIYGSVNGLSKRIF